MTDAHTPRLPFIRCPECGALHWPTGTAIHRPACDYTDTDPATWHAGSSHG